MLKLIMTCASGMLIPVFGYAQTAIPKITLGIGQASSTGDITVTLQVMLLLTVLSLAPSILIMMTSFTRIIVILHFLRQAIGTQSMPPNQLVVGLALFLTMFVMQSTVDQIYETAWKPYKAGTINIQEAYKTSQKPITEFMLKQTREKDLALFVKLSGRPQPDSPVDLPLSVVVPGFAISELRTAFQIGFLIYMPFLVIDMVVASVLMSMGMMMLPPAMVSLPFKILLFVLVDGWYLTVEAIVKGFK